MAGECPVSGGAHSYSTYTKDGKTVVYCINCQSPS